MSRPTLNTSTIDGLIEKDKQIEKKKTDIKKLRSRVSVKPANAAAYWQEEEVVLLYGPYSITYALIPARFVARKAAQRENTKARKENMTEEQKDENRLRFCSLKTASVRRRKAERDAQRFKLVRP